MSYMDGWIVTAAMSVATLLAAWLLERGRRRAQMEARKLAALLDAAPEGIFGVGDDGRIRFANSHASTQFGYTADELIGQSIEMLIPDEHRDEHVAKRNRYTERPTVRPMGAGLVIRGRRKDGSEFPAEISLNRIERNRKALVLCVVRDVTEQRRIQSELIDANTRLRNGVSELQQRASELRQLARAGELLQSCLDENETEAVVARAVANLLPGAEARISFLVAASPRESSLTLEDCWALRHGQWQWSAPGAAQVRCRHTASESERDHICVPLVAQGETMGVLHVNTASAGQALEVMTGPYRQIVHALAAQSALGTANLRLREALRIQATRDPLTGLHNRRHFDESVDRLLSVIDESQAPLSLLIIDLDHFKRFNDLFGHQGGDQVLRSTAATLVAHMRLEDVVCRLGGEEFGVLLPLTSTLEARRIAERIRWSVEDGQRDCDRAQAACVTVSIGVASSGPGANTADALFRKADSALYAAKADGRNRIRVAIETTRSALA